MKYLVHAHLTGKYVTTVEADSRFNAVEIASKELEDITDGKMHLSFVTGHTWEIKEEGEK